MDGMIWIVGGIELILGLILRFISEKTGYDFNDKRFFEAPEDESTPYTGDIGGWNGPNPGE
jgi:hypothetical protein